MSALGVIGFSQEEVQALYEILASILLLVAPDSDSWLKISASPFDPDPPLQGNLQFESDGESVQIQDLEAVGHLSELTGTDPDGVSKSLLFRTVATGGGEVIEKGHTEQEACCGRDAFAKVLKADAHSRSSSDLLLNTLLSPQGSLRTPVQLDRGPDQQCYRG